MYSTAVCVVVLLLVLPMVTPTPHPDRRYLANNARSINFKCNVPQPRSKYFWELSPKATHNRKITPGAVVLHRCDSGCGVCPDSQTCGPVEALIETVHLTFMITEGDKNPIYETHPFQNHTMCECLPRVEVLRV